MKDLLFLAADLWLMATCWYFGIKIFRRYRNHLLTLEYLVVAVSSTNFLLWALTGGSESSPMYSLAYALDAFSRSFGITLILVLGLMRVTHLYKPPLWVEVGATALALAGAVLLGPIHSDTLDYDDSKALAIAVFYVVTNLLTAAFLMYFAWRLWQIGAVKQAVAAAAVTALASYVAISYDFFPFSFDDEHRTIFYILALTTWGLQAVVYYVGYQALHDHNVETGAESDRAVAVAR
ncbi:hypothetical protein ABT304_21785 [Nocardioides sp. NPDC000445]|uniref:hypothetical protein n=1 Tax=Nocardioides sp. NPDC000445 TaxID=3154257 RepID=UPI0033203FCE